MSKIESIKEVDDVKLSNETWAQFTGYEVKTATDTYQVLISNEQSCCEDFGYLTTNDNIQEFIGAELLEVVTTDTSLSGKNFMDGIEEADCMFVDFKTSKGTLQLVVYNQHNGYYGHDVLLLKNNKAEVETTL